MSWLFDITEENRADLIAMIRDAPAGWRMALAEPEHTPLQRKKFNAMCGDLSRQVTLGHDRLTQEEFKHWIVAAWKQQKMVEGDQRGSIVFVGEGLKKKSKADVAELIEVAFAFGASRDVVWSEKSKQVIEEWENAA